MFADKGYEVWQIQGNGEQFTEPAIAIANMAPKVKGDLAKQQAYWVAKDTIAWAAATDAFGAYQLHFDPNAGLTSRREGRQRRPKHQPHRRPVRPQRCDQGQIPTPGRSARAQNR